MGDLDELLSLLRGGRVLVVTGVGMDGPGLTQSDFGPEGLWTRIDPIIFDEFTSSEEARRSYWQRIAPHIAAVTEGEPNANYAAIAKLAQAGRLEAVVTQSVDGWHIAAGLPSQRLVELHGSLLQCECIACFHSVPTAQAMNDFRKWDIAPRCSLCGGALKPATINYGQQLRHGVLERALAYAKTCKSVIVFGSTLSVVPVAAIPAAAASRGCPYAIVEPLDTEHDDRATIRLYDEVEDILPALAEA